MSDFESAARAVVDGELEMLERMLLANPNLVTARSPNHGATLLHYVGANGPVEDDMQRSPANAVAIAETLIQRGADVDAVIDGEPASTPLVSLVTSEFPAEAGVQRELVELFLNCGASVNGLNDDGYPLAAALLFGYPDAIDALIAGGARIDNLVAAAALGKMDYLQGCFDDVGNLTSSALPYPDPFGREFCNQEVIQVAIEHAKQYLQEEAVEFLTLKSSTK